MSAKAKRIAKAIGLGVLLQAHLFILASTMGSRAVQACMLWNLRYLCAPAGTPSGPETWPLALYDAVLVVGFALGIAVYSTAFYFVLRARDARRSQRADTSAGAAPLG